MIQYVIAESTVDEELHEVLPWIWCKGGRRAEDEVVKILGRGSKARSTSDFAEWDAGAVALARIKVAVPDAPRDFDVEQEPLVAEVCKALTLKADDVETIAGIAFRSSEQSNP